MKHLNVQLSPKHIKVAVAMSGGVDSSVTAVLLKNKGYKVVGITMRIWSCNDDYSARKKLCCSLTDTKDAKKVAYKLNIPHYTLDLRKEFDEYVIKPFCESYAKGYTPNPCILCNQKIKFNILLKKIKSLGFDYLATGHYAIIKPETKGYLLKKGIDRNSDQSYWLYCLKQNQLKNILMPLGEYTKEEVRNLAKKFGLPVADKPKSQEICFIQEKDYREFLQKKLKKLQKGKIVDIKGNFLRYHNGISNFTIGQREGLGISLGKRIYVVDIIPEENKIVVGEEKDVYRNELIVNNINWIMEKNKLKFPLGVKTKIRYKHKESESIIYKTDKNYYKIKFKEPQWAITYGQSAVFYDKNIVLGGGIIQRNDSNN